MTRHSIAVSIDIPDRKLLGFTWGDYRRAIADLNIADKALFTVMEMPKEEGTAWGPITITETPDRYTVQERDDTGLWWVLDGRNGPGHVIVATCTSAESAALVAGALNDAEDADV